MSGCTRLAFGCLAGALNTDTYRDLLTTAGFEDVSMEITRRYTVAEAGLDTGTLPEGWQAGDGKLASAFVRATKPQTATLPIGPAPMGAGSGCCGR